MEEVSQEKPKSRLENECENLFARTTTRGSNGRYTVRLPFREKGRRLGNSRASAYRRLLALERRFDSNASLKAEYSKVVEEYLSLGHMSLAENPEEEGYYMPHHAVVKESSNTTKVRLVCDASAKASNGVSLNDLLLIGPTIQNKLIIHLLRLRTFRHVLIADIEKMYRQVRLHEDDCRYQRILWRINGKVETLQLNTLSFGIPSSPFLAIRVIQQLADDERHEFPRAADILCSHLYVDDLLSGANTIGEARGIRDELIAVLKRGGFTIRQWASDDEQIIKGLESNTIHKNFTVDANHSLKTLGITWSAREDKFYYLARPIRETDKWTKRSILSEIAKIFDPLGLLGPVILYAKRIMQNVWRCGLQWDESVPQSLYTEWSTFSKQLVALNQVAFDRKLFINRRMVRSPVTRVL